MQSDPRASVLLVDDSPANLLALRAVLDNLDLDFVEARSGEEALRHLETQDFAVVLLDVQMHGLDGFETARLIRARDRSRHTPIVFVTGRCDDPLSVEQAYSLGAVDYLIKPILPVVLRAKVAGFVDLFRKGERIRQMERQRAEEALRQSEERFSHFMQHLPGLAWIKDLQGRYVYANDAALRIFQRPRAELYGQTDEQVFPPDTAAQFRNNDQAALASPAGMQVIETLLHDDGVVHHSLVSKFPIPGPDDRPALVGGMAIDVTEHMRTRAVLEESEQRFRQLAEHVSAVFRITDPHKPEVLYVSPAYEQVWGRPCRSLYEQPRSFLDAIHPDDRTRVAGETLARHVRGEQSDVEYRVVRPDGSVRWVRDRGFPIHDPAGRVYRVAGIAEDVTDWKEAQQALREADRRKDEFLAMLAHELRNPLAPIRNAVQVMRLLGLNDPHFQRARDLIERQVLHLTRLVDDLLDVSRITRGKIALRLEPVDLAAIVSRAVETSRPLIEANRHQLTLALFAGPVRVVADPTRLEQVFVNLLNNAAKYSERGCSIWVTGERQDSDVLVRIRDTGFGIPAEVLPRIFDLFAQADRTLDRSQGGLGIGLTLVRSLVELHGGTVEAHSEGPGKGSEFVVRLPAVEEASTSGKQAEPGAAVANDGPPLSILVVDDNADAADSLAWLLRRWGHEVRTAHDGLAGLKEALAHRPQIVLLDIGLPGLDGYEVARRLRVELGRQALLVAVTGYGQEEDRRLAEEAGFDAHLTKPADPGVLERLLAGVRLEYRR